MKTMHAAMFLLIASVVSTTSAATPPSGVATLYGDWSQESAISSDTMVWADTPDGAKKKWTSGSYGIVTAVRSAGDSFDLHGLTFWGIRFDQAYISQVRWDSGSSLNTVGAGGIEFSTNNALNVGSAACKTRLKLTASQTWQGPASSAKPAYFSIGHDNYGAFHQASATSTVDCTELTIRGNLSTWFTWTNYFGATSVRVEKPARIWLEKLWTNDVERIGTPQLNAKKLTLAGDGVMWNAGGKSTVASARGKWPQIEPEMNVRTVATTLALEDGADLVGTGAGWDIPTVEVSGSGESAFTGDWTFRRARTTVSIASGATLALTGTCREPDGLSAGFDVTGGGTLKVKNSAFRLSGVIDLGAASVLEIDGQGLLSVPVTGAGRIRLSGQTTGILPVSGKVLNGFSGVIEVVAGNVYFESLPKSVSVTTSGTGVVYTDATLPTYYGDWSQDPIVWTNAQGEAGAPVDYANGVVEKVPAKTCNFGGTSVFHGLTLSAERKTNFWISKGDFRIGSGGIVFTTPCDLPFGGTKTKPMLTLTADQEWKGPASGGTYATLSVGFPGYAHHGYHLTTLGVDSGAEALKISGMLMAYFPTTNSLSSLDVEVASPAKLILCDRWTVNNSSQVWGDARLGAKTLTLSGDGDGQLPLGATGVYFPYAVSGLSTITTLDATHVAGALVLKNGADLTASSPVRFDLPGLTVAGPGTSVLSGTFDLARTSLTVALSDDATLDLKGTLNETQSGTTFSATGSGTVILRGGDGLTGGVSLGTDVTLKLIDHSEFSRPVTGGKALEFSCAGKILFVPASVLTGFTGSTVTVTAGTVVFEALPEGVSLVEDGGVAKRVTDNTDGTWLVTDAPRSESVITVGAGQTLTVCGCGLTDTTKLALAGGRVEFVRSTTVSSAVDYVSNSSVGAAARVTGTIAGFVTASNDNASADCQLSLSGKGTVNLAGGGVFERVKFYVTEGSANLTGGHFLIARQSWGVYEGDFLGVSGSATVECPYPGESGVHYLWCWPKYGKEAVVEIGTGGVVRLGQNIRLVVGRNDQTVSMPGTLRLAGGSFTLDKSYTMSLGGQNGGRGRIELTDGEFVTDQAFQCPYSTGAGDIAWYGGTVRLGDGFFTFGGNPNRYFDGASSNLTVRLLGPNCRLDLNGVTAFTNVLANAENAASWTAAPGSCLTVANGGTCVFQRFPAGGTIGVDGCSALIDDPSGPQISAVVFRGTGADVVRTTSATTQDVSVVVATDGVWGTGQLEGLAVDDLSFEDGAGLRLFLREDGAVIPLSIPGSVTCGGVLGIDFVQTGRLPPAGPSVLLSAVGGLTAPTSFVGLSKATRGATFAAEGDDLVANIVRPGMCLIFR